MQNCLNSCMNLNWLLWYFNWNKQNGDTKIFNAMLCDGVFRSFKWQNTNYFWSVFKVSFQVCFVFVNSDMNSVSCPSVNPAGHGYLMCSRSMILKPWKDKRKTTNQPGTKCFLKCPPGYQLHGEYELTCLSNGTWDGPKHGECVRKCIQEFINNLRIIYRY